MVVDGALDVDEVVEGALDVDEVLVEGDFELLQPTSAVASVVASARASVGLRYECFRVKVMVEILSRLPAGKTAGNTCTPSRRQAHASRGFRARKFARRIGRNK